MFAAPTMLTRLVHSPAAPRFRIENLKTIYYGGGPMYVEDSNQYVAYSAVTALGQWSRLPAETAAPRAPSSPKP